MLWILSLAWMAGLSILAGALVSSNVVLRDACLRLKLDRFVSYFGSGALLAALALVLIPRGVEQLSVLAVAASFGLGALVFWKFSVWTSRTNNQISRFVSMLLDFFPEVILLGALAASGSNAVYLLAGLIALQNMPQGFTAFTEMDANMRSRTCLLIIFFTVSLLGPLGAWLGLAWLSTSDSLLALVLLFCSGGILHLLFQDIAPRSHDEDDTFAAIGAICGFLVGLVGTMLIH